MTTLLQTLSWPLFFLLLAVLIALWILTTKTRTGRSMVERETYWTVRQWRWLLIAIGATGLVLVNPIAHLIGIVVLGGLYYMLVASPKQRQSLLQSSTNKSLVNQDIGAVPVVGQLELYCTADAEIGLTRSKSALQQCLFSFPYLDQQVVPSVHYLDGRFEIAAVLSSDKYKASLVDYIRHAGFQIEYKN